VHGGPPDTSRPGEAGFTLPEVLVVCVVGVLVLGAVIGFIAFSFGRNNVTVGRVDALDRTMQGVDAMQREMRQALDVLPHKTTSAASSRVDVVVYTQASPTSPVSSTPHTVRYDCDNPGSIAGTYKCTRQDLGASGGSPGPVSTVIDGVTSAPVGVFTLVPPIAPAILQTVRIAMRVRIAGANNPLAIDTTVAPRNCIDGPTPGGSTCTG
jgi:type II secretory pathway pseudopilin PulG